tara:strand:- start:373 stop:834 length:462 start_codon:yes stop_codon:yes gene_type:complete
MSKYSAFLKIFFLISLYGCGYNQLISKPDINNSISITFDKSIPIPMVAKLKSTFDTNADSDAISVSIKNYSMKKYNVYGGNALRALEGELTLKTQIMIQSATKSSNKYLSSMKRYKSNELNPYAEDEMIKLLESEMQREILNKILIEVNFFEM